MKCFKTIYLALTVAISLQSMLNSFNLSKKEALEILGLQENSTQEDLNRSYRKLALKFHPDKGGLTADQKIEATKKFQELGEAKAKLESTLQAKAWINNKTKTWINDEGNEKQGFEYWITKWLKQDENKSNFQQNQESIWDFIEDKNIGEIKKAMLESNTYDKETIKEEIIKLAIKIDAASNPQFQQEEADRLKQEQERANRETEEQFQKQEDLARAKLETEEQQELEIMNEQYQEELERARLETEEQQELEQLSAAKNQSANKVQKPKTKELATQALELATSLS